MFGHRNEAGPSQAFDLVRPDETPDSIDDETDVGFDADSVLEELAGTSQYTGQCVSPLCMMPLLTINFI
jgi:hypothetical protein